MARSIKEIAVGLGAKIIGPVSGAGGGAFGAAQTAQRVEALKMAAEDAGNAPGWIGSMRDYAEEMDAIVADAMQRRRLEAWHPGPERFAALESMIEATGRTLNELLDEAVSLLLHKWINISQKTTR